MPIGICGGDMATPEFAIEPPARGRGHRPLPYFFPGMAAFAAVILAFTFIPEFFRFAAGTFPIAWVLHIHAAIMFSWVAAFALQAYLGTSGRTATHRRIGTYAIAIGWLAWVSMIFVEFRGLAVYPPPQDPADYDWTLPGPFIYLTFGLFLAWAVHERTRSQWHKRLMTFALFLSVGAAIQRYHWIPRPKGFGYGAIAFALDLILLAPLVVYDLRTLKRRLHPATVRGAVLLLGSEVVLFVVWGSAPWREFASYVAHRIHG